MPNLYDPQHVANIELQMHGAIGLEVVFCEHKKRVCRLDSTFLQVNEGPGQLDQPLIKRAFWPMPRRQPEWLQDFVSFIEELLVEALEITQIVWIEAAPLTLSDDRGDSGALHKTEGRGWRLRGPGWSIWLPGRCADIPIRQEFLTGMSGEALTRGELYPNRDMLRVEERVQAFASQLAAPTALFDPAKWRLGRGWEAVVDADHSGVQ